MPPKGTLADILSSRKKKRDGYMEKQLFLALFLRLDTSARCCFLITLAPRSAQDGDDSEATGGSGAATEAPPMCGRSLVPC